MSYYITSKIRVTPSNKGNETKHSISPFTTSEIMASYPLEGNGGTRYEFQIDRRLVWVFCSSELQKQHSFDIANAIFPKIFTDISEVISIAEKVSRTQDPEFWAKYDELHSTEHPLDVWGFHLNPINGSVFYDVSANHEFFNLEIAFSVKQFGIKHRLKSEEFSLLIDFLKKINFFDRMDREYINDDMLSGVYIHRSPAGELSPGKFDFNKFYSINPS